MAAGCALSYWQYGRAQLKEGLQAQADSRIVSAPRPIGTLVGLSRDELAWTPAVAAGEYDATRQLLVDNRIDAGRAGFHVITPLALAAAPGRWLLVNRGWIPAPADRNSGTITPPVPPAGTVTVTGLLMRDEQGAFELGAAAGQPGLWLHLDIERWQQATGLRALPAVLAAGDPPDGLAAVVRRPQYKAQRSYGYSLQWAGLALALAAGWLAFALRQGRGTGQ